MIVKLSDQNMLSKVVKIYFQTSESFSLQSYDKYSQTKNSSRSTNKFFKKVIVNTQQQEYKLQFYNNLLHYPDLVPFFAQRYPILVHRDLVCKIRT